MVSLQNDRKLCLIIRYVCYLQGCQCFKSTLNIYRTLFLPYNHSEKAFTMNFKDQ